MNRGNTAVIAIIIVALLVVGGIYYWGRGGAPTPPPAPEPPLVEPTPPPPPVVSDEIGGPKVFNLTASPFAFSVKEMKVKKGQGVKVVLTNTEGLHDWTLPDFDVQTKQLRAGQSDSIEFVASQTGTFEFFCSVGDHRSRGMKGKLIVTE